MISRFSTFLKYFIPFTALLFFGHYFAVQSLLSTLSFELETWSIYAFLFTTTLVIYFFLLFVNRTFPDKTGFAFLTGSVLKMMASVIFLLPIIQSKNDVIPDALAFFIPYFLFLFFETFFAIRLINKPE